MRRDSRMKTALLPLLCAASLTGCVAGLGHPEPPAPLPEFQSTAPAPGMVWVAGYWHWDGTDHVWVPGHWESPPPAP
jgi:hypothetical protein